MKILHIIFSFNIGGAEAMLADIINSQCKHVQVKLIIVNSGINTALLASVSKNVEVICLNRRPGSVNPIPLILLNREIRKFKPDVIHCHNRNMVNAIWWLSYRRKSLLTIHDTGGTFKYIHKFKACIAISEAVKTDVLERSKLDIDIIYNGVRCTDIKAKSTDAAKVPPDRITRVVQVSRLHHEKKGQHLALMAIRKMIDKGYCPIQLDFIGTGKSLDYLKRLSSDLGIGAYVQFLGIKSRAYIYEHLSEYDLLIQPSLYEGFGLTVAEAMAAKVPVLVSNIEGPMELIKNGTYGAYFESGNAEDLALKFIEFTNLMGTELLRERVERAYVYCNKHFNISVTADAYISKYKTLQMESDFCASTSSSSSTFTSTS